MYITNPTATSTQFAQILKDYRTDGTAHALVGDSTTQAHLQQCINTFGNVTLNRAAIGLLCGGAVVGGFANAVNFVWSHESRHMTAGVNSAKQAANDVYKLWEPLVREDASTLRQMAQELYVDSHQNVQMACDDNAVHIGNSVQFTFPTWIGSLWTYGLFTYAD